MCGYKRESHYLTAEVQRIAGELGMDLHIRWHESSQDFDREAQTIEIKVGSKRETRKYPNSTLSHIPEDAEVTGDSVNGLRQWITSLG